ncbi:hypothetical protein ACFL6N_02295 [Thermodesulfobacteriota bacterium]
MIQKHRTASSQKPYYSNFFFFAVNKSDGRAGDGEEDEEELPHGNDFTGMESMNDRGSL